MMRASSSSCASSTRSGCAFGALGAECPCMVRAQVESFGGDPLAR